MLLQVCEDENTPLFSFVLLGLKKRQNQPISQPSKQKAPGCITSVESSSSPEAILSQDLLKNIGIKIGHVIVFKYRENILHILIPQRHFCQLVLPGQS